MFRDHTVSPMRVLGPSSSTHKQTVYSTLLAMRWTICQTRGDKTRTAADENESWDVCLLRKEERKLQSAPTHDPQHASRLERQPSLQPNETIPVVRQPSPSISGRKPLVQGTTEAKKHAPMSEEEEDEPDRQQLPGIACII